MTIAEVSKKYDITADTLRYYERIGLIPPVPRTKSGIRDYDDVSCGWIELMICMRRTMRNCFTKKNPTVQKNLRTGC